ncbi:MAG: response regulator transcription factor [Chloroflexota bacterium]|nr:MAG: response regulator transcription factor [Chloroflexota bacterium]
MSIRVFLCDDHAVLRAGLKALLATETGIEVIGEAGDGEEAVDAIAVLKPDVALIDITMPGIDGLETTRRIIRGVPGVRVLILTMHDDPEYLYQSLDAGAAGYVLKRAAETDLIDAIRSVISEETFLAPTAFRSIVADYVARRDRGELVGPIERLTAREEEVLRLLAQGYTNMEIADALVISVKTVETHRAHILDKLGLRKRAELVRYARTHGLLVG